MTENRKQEPVAFIDRLRIPKRPKRPKRISLESLAELGIEPWIIKAGMV